MNQHTHAPRLSEREKLKPEKRSSSHFEENNGLDDVYEVIHVHVLSLNSMLVPVLKRPKGLQEQQRINIRSCTNTRDNHISFDKVWIINESCAYGRHVNLEIYRYHQVQYVSKTTKRQQVNIAASYFYSHMRPEDLHQPATSLVS